MDRQSLFEEYLLEDISEIEFDYLLAHGTRHFGDYFFRPRCQGCSLCVPIRVRVGDFRATRSQKRSLKSCCDVKIRMGKPKFSDEKFDLYLTHKQRFTSLVDDVEDSQNFRLSFYSSTPFGVEFEYFLDGNLIGVALADITRNAFSAIYTFYDAPDPSIGLGTFSILKQLEYCVQHRINYFYLGYYIAQNKSLMYKANFRPNEVYIDNVWRPFRNAAGDRLLPESKLVWENKEFLVQATPRKDY